MDIIMGIEQDTVVIRREFITARAICQENESPGVQANVVERLLSTNKPWHSEAPSPLYPPFPKEGGTGLFGVCAAHFVRRTHT